MLHDIFLAQRKAHVPLVAAARVTHRIKAVITGNHLNRTATSGYVARLVRAIFPLVAATTNYPHAPCHLYQINIATPEE
jgi:hypothetical protein